jgi:hypothetical protein
MERAPSGEVRTRLAEPGVRWPSYGAGGRLVVFTTLAHQVEYWLAENPFGPGSPLHDPAPRPPVAGGAAIGAAALSGPRLSPVHLQHR